MILKINKEERMILEKYFIIHENDDYMCFEMWTNGGVNMFIETYKENNVTSPLEVIEEYLEYFDIDETIDLHRQGKEYKEVFTIRASLEDFEDYVKTLEDICSELRGLNNG